MQKAQQNRCFLRGQKLPAVLTLPGKHDAKFNANVKGGQKTPTLGTGTGTGEGGTGTGEGGTGTGAGGAGAKKKPPAGCRGP